MPAQAVRSDVIGSLLRPDYLKLARDQFEREETASCAATPSSAT